MAGNTPYSKESITDAVNNFIGQLQSRIAPIISINTPAAIEHPNFDEEQSVPEINPIVIQQQAAELNKLKEIFRRILDGNWSFDHDIINPAFSLFPEGRTCNSVIKNYSNYYNNIDLKSQLNQTIPMLLISQRLFIPQSYTCRNYSLLIILNCLISSRMSIHLMKNNINTGRSYKLLLRRYRMLL